MPVYYSTPIYYITPAHYAPPPYTHYYTAAPTGTPTYYPNHFPNHRRTVGPRHHNHRWTAGPQRHQVVTQAQVPEVLYATPRPPAQTYTPVYPPRRRRGLLVDTAKTTTWNHAPSENQNRVLYSTSMPRPLYTTKYIPSLSWPNLGPHEPQALQAGIPTQGARRKLRIAFNLRKPISRKEGIPLSFLLQEDVSTLKRLVERPYEQVLPHSDGKTASITLRFWSPAHPYPVQEHSVSMDPKGHDLTRLALALHVAQAYQKAVSDVPEWHPSQKVLKRTQLIGPRTMSLGYVWLVSLRGTEREDVFDVGVQNHGFRASSVW